MYILNAPLIRFIISLTGLLSYGKMWVSYKNIVTNHLHCVGNLKASNILYVPGNIPTHIGFQNTETISFDLMYVDNDVLPSKVTL